MLTALLLTLVGQASGLPPQPPEPTPPPDAAAENASPAWDATPQLPGLPPAPAPPSDADRHPLADAPRAARLLESEDVSGRPVEQLSLAQLYWERHRLTVDFPGLGGPIAMMAGGSLGAIVSGVFTGILIPQTTCTGGSYLFGCTRGADYAPFFGVIAAAALGVAIIGLVLFIDRLHARDESLARRGRINARLMHLPGGGGAEPDADGPSVSAAELAALRLQWLEEEQPGLGLPIALLAVGIGAGVYAGLMGSGSVVVAIVAAVVSGILVLSGGGLLAFRIHERVAFSARMKRLRDGTEQLDGPGEPALSEPDPRATRPSQPAAAWQPPAPPIAFAMNFSF